MITGAHSIIHSTNPEADRAFIRDVLGLSGVDAGGGWLIFGLPAAEVAVHPSQKNDAHELYLLCDDVERWSRAWRGGRSRAARWKRKAGACAAGSSFRPAAGSGCTSRGTHGPTR